MTIEPAVERRKRIFAALVKAQDEGTSVRASRSQVAGVFGITTSEVEAIEKEGLAHRWPPL